MDAYEHRSVDEETFNELFDAHYEALRRFVGRRIAERDSIDDVLSETFVVLWSRRQDAEEIGPAFVFGVCRRVIKNHRRGARRRQRLWSRLASSPREASRDPSEIHEERSEIREAFSGLPERQREVLRLVAWDGLNTAEAAAILGCSEAAFRVRLHRARVSLAAKVAVDSQAQLLVSDPTTLEEAR
ncbi:MAG: sigma-70 family RNA polymerase sigma factor [Acidobacteria bacterium]|nr:MAG: sigma-70 family RNA polymerase sigma factor [Acidobacteriota bacterium]GIK76723.1 MAG: siderophore-interacting protein [Actinomycetes bacterium]